MVKGDRPHTPVMAQYWRIKQKYPQEILLFRLGDFYECFEEDASIASRVLGIALTSRNKQSEHPIPMAGVPYHAVDEYIHKLLEAGYRVAVCEQLEEPQPGKKLVERQVVRVITPGTVIEEGVLTSAKTNYLVSLAHHGDTSALACAETSTGELSLTFFEDYIKWDNITDELDRLSPAEILLPEGEECLMGFIPDHSLITYLSADNYYPSRAYRRVLDGLAVANLEGYDLEGNQSAISALGALFAYLEHTYMKQALHLRSLNVYSVNEYMTLDAKTSGNLELVEPSSRNARGGTLLRVLDYTQTAMGKRTLRSWILAPLLDVAKIEERLSAVQAFYNDTLLRDSVQGILSKISDLERLVGRIALGTAKGRDLANLRESLAIIPELSRRLTGKDTHLIVQASSDLAGVEEVANIISSALVEEPPLTLTEGGLIKDGFSSELDELKGSVRQAVDWIANLQARERERTRIPSLKVGFNKVFGYYIEVTKTHINKVPGDYQRKQTTVGGERFITIELEEKESQVLSAEERINRLEYELFVKLREQVAEFIPDIKRSAKAIATIDCLSALAKSAVSNRYARPQVDESDTIHIVDGRHPIVEKYYLEEDFVPNDTELSPQDLSFIILTGPNMAGKSTYLRQVALICLMAQMGSFVPAKKARLGLVDRIFTRIGAQDELSAGRSTFLVEMNETAQILFRATEKSLVLLDEIGRGTSTYDGVSLAWAIAEFIHNHIRAKTLFATHYHELAYLTKVLPRAHNYTVAVREKEGEIIFLRKVLPGVTDRSYGISVARLAGLPEPVVVRAREVLSLLEGVSEGFSTPLAQLFPENEQVSIFHKTAEDNQVPPHPILSRLAKIEADKLSPLEALNLLAELSDKARREEP